MLYRLLLWPARIALHFYCKAVRINIREPLELDGPLILAANHPNSFLDAIILASVFKKPIYSLARGDAFTSKLVVRLLTSLNMLPVYRISEGADNLKSNYDTFEKVQELLDQNKIVLIFSEGLCINEWRLRPLKKGTARMAFQAWDRRVPMKILPTGINYSSFHRFGKSVTINFGNIFGKELFNEDSEGKNIIKFNQHLKDELSALIYEIPADDLQLRKKIFEVRSGKIQKTLLALPAALGYLIHFPFYFAAHKIIGKKSGVHYDSIMVGILFLFYPWYLILLTGLLYCVTASSYSLLFIIAALLSALSLLHYRNVVS